MTLPDLLHTREALENPSRRVVLRAGTLSAWFLNGSKATLHGGSFAVLGGVSACSPCPDEHCRNGRSL